MTLPADASEPITTIFPDGFLGVLTISSSKLGVEHLRAAGVPRARMADVVVQVMEEKSEFAQQFWGIGL